MASVIRPLSVAAVYAMLTAARPIRLLTAYVVAGFVFSVGIGVVLVTLLGVSAGPRSRAVLRGPGAAMRRSYPTVQEGNVGDVVDGRCTDAGTPL